MKLTHHTLRSWFANHADGEFQVCAAVAVACLGLGCLAAIVNYFSPGTTSLSALIVPGLLYLLMGASRLPSMLRSGTHHDSHRSVAGTDSQRSADVESSTVQRRSA